MVIVMIALLWMLGFMPALASYQILYIDIEDGDNKGKAHTVEYSMGVEVQRLDTNMDFDIYSFF